MAHNSSVLAHAWKRWKAWRALVFDVVFGTAVGLLGRFIVSGRISMSPDTADTLKWTAAGVAAVGGLSFLWHLWLAPYEILQEKLGEIAAAIKESPPPKLTLCPTAKKLLVLASTRGADIESSAAGVRLRKNIEFAGFSSPSLPLYRAAVSQLLSMQLLEALPEQGRFSVSDKGHWMIDGLSQEDRGSWGTER